MSLRLATTLSRLRKLIGAHAINRHDGRLGLEPTLCWVDCWALKRALGGNPKSTSPDALAEKMRRLYGGHFLHGDHDARWALHFRGRLHVNVVASYGQMPVSLACHGDARGMSRG